MTGIIEFSNGDFHATILLERLPDLTFAKTRKLFTLMLSEAWHNQEAITETGRYIESAIQDSKAAWALASQEYVHGWRKIEKPTRRRTKKEVQATAQIRERNEALTRAVKKSKALYERWVKIGALWEDTKHQMKF